LLLGLRARDVSSRRDGSKIFLQITPLNTLRDSILNTTVRALNKKNRTPQTYDRTWPQAPCMQKAPETFALGTHTRHHDQDHAAAKKTLERPNWESKRHT
jgi:hypothetical protein